MDFANHPRLLEAHVADCILRRLEAIEEVFSVCFLTESICVVVLTSPSFLGPGEVGGRGAGAGGALGVASFVNVCVAS